jgi:hypothetical protein
MNKIKSNTHIFDIYDSSVEILNSIIENSETQLIKMHLSYLKIFDCSIRKISLENLKNES